MKTKLVNCSLIICFAFLSLFANRANAQIDIMGRLLTGGIDDAEKISEAYMNPFIDGFSANLNSGWYNTAKPHRLGGFDLTLSLNTSIVPSSARYYDLESLNLEGIVEGDSEAPTFSATSDIDRPILRYYKEFNGEDIELASFRVPNGTGLAYIPAPMIQAGVGLPFDTDIIFRYMPNMDLGSTGKMGLYGFGLKHSLKQWLPFVKRLPIVNVSVMGGYTIFNTSSGMDLKPVDVDAEDRTSDVVNFDNQALLFNVNSLTVNLIGSVDIPFFAFYGAVGLTSNTANLKLNGYYPIPTLDITDGTRIVTDDSVVREDPIDIVVQGDANKTIPRYNLGMKLKLGLFHINFDYTYAHYSVATVGMALSFR
ncbi:MAG: DUF6588 family protein, partial [Bacteroidota bacterium]